MRQRLLTSVALLASVLLAHCSTTETEDREPQGIMPDHGALYAELQTDVLAYVNEGMAEPLHQRFDETLSAQVSLTALSDGFEQLRGDKLGEFSVASSTFSEGLYQALLKREIEGITFYAEVRILGDLYYDGGAISGFRVRLVGDPAITESSVLVLDTSERIRRWLTGEDDGGFHAMLSDVAAAQITPELLAASAQQLAAQGLTFSSATFLKHRRDLEFDGLEFRGLFQVPDGSTLPMNIVLTSSARLDAGSPLPETQHLEGLMIRPEQSSSVEEIALADLPSRLQALPTQTSVNAVWVDADGTETTVFSFQPDVPLAVGSTFKLYVLAAVDEWAQGSDGDWDDELTVTEFNRSLPSGRLFTAELGTTVTVRDAAIRMIAESDNTATDMLIDLVGRKTIEDGLSRWGVSQPQGLVPFLKTRELFQLKLLPDYEARLVSFKSANPNERRTILEALADEDLPSLDAAGDWTEPRAIDFAEWFVSTQDLTAFFVKVAGREHASSEPSRVALRRNPIVPPDGAYAVSGAKGGSEPGVLNVTQWLTFPEDRHLMLSVTMNATEAGMLETGLASIELYRSIRSAIVKQALADT